MTQGKPRQREGKWKTSTGDNKRSRGGKKKTRSLLFARALRSLKKENYRRDGGENYHLKTLYRQIKKKP